MRTAMALVVVLLLATACSTSRDARVLDAKQSAGGRLLQVGLDACNGDNEIVVTEDANAVTVTAKTDDAPGGDDCMDWVDVPFNAPLGDRRLIDGSTGDVVDVRREP